MILLEYTVSLLVDPHFTVSKWRACIPEKNSVIFTRAEIRERYREVGCGEQGERMRIYLLANLERIAHPALLL